MGHAGARVERASRHDATDGHEEQECAGEDAAGKEVGSIDRGRGAEWERTRGAGRLAEDPKSSGAKQG